MQLPISRSMMCSKLPTTECMDLLQALLPAAMHRQPHPKGFPIFLR